MRSRRRLPITRWSPFALASGWADRVVAAPNAFGSLMLSRITGIRPPSSPGAERAFHLLALGWLAIVFVVLTALNRPSTSGIYNQFGNVPAMGPDRRQSLFSNPAGRQGETFRRPSI
ncbi:MAG: hypothetical protein R3D03_13485 [Geminicoccaceae bacterium]